MRSWTKDKRRVDHFEPEIKRILGETFIGTADFKRDAKQATDLLVLEVKPITVACRVRRYSYLDNYGEEFTIRFKRHSGAETEFSKIVNGWCDYGFYGFADEEDHHVLRWTIYRLDLFRATLIRKPKLTEQALCHNDDGSSDFLAFRWSDFPGEMVVSQAKPPVAVPEPVFDTRLMSEGHEADCWIDQFDKDFG